MKLLPLAWLTNLGPFELLIILFIILLIFGAKRLPELMRSMGTGVKEFKKGMKEEDKKEEGPSEDEERKSSS